MCNFLKFFKFLKFLPGLMSFKVLGILGPELCVPSANGPKPHFWKFIYRKRSLLEHEGKLLLNSRMFWVTISARTDFHVGPTMILKKIKNFCFRKFPCGKRLKNFIKFFAEPKNQLAFVSDLILSFSTFGVFISRNNFVKNKQTCGGPEIVLNTTPK